MYTVFRTMQEHYQVRDGDSCLSTVMSTFDDIFDAIREQNRLSGTPLRKVEAFEVQDHGIDHAQHFQGVGVSCTDWESVHLGIGDTPAEALDDALEMLAQSTDGLDLGDLETRMVSAYGYLFDDDTTSAIEHFGYSNFLTEEDDIDECELHYYVSVWIR